MDCALQSTWALHDQPSSYPLWCCLLCDVSLRQDSRHHFHNLAGSQYRLQKSFIRHAAEGRVCPSDRSFLRDGTSVFRFCPSIRGHLRYRRSDKPNIHVCIPHTSGTYFLPWLHI
jgi:hypothetical protein